MSAPENLAAWMATHEHKDKKLPYVYRYHPRGDLHSVVLCELVMLDLLSSCQSLQEQASSGEVAYGINVKHAWATTSKTKALDLAVGIPAEPALPSVVGNQIRKVKNRKRKSGEVVFAAENALARLLVACEAKAVMTEHVKSQPRLFDELSSSHEIVHQGDQETIATGIVMVNIASNFVSPLRQRDANNLHLSAHDQPVVAARMIQHLRGLRSRDDVGQVGFDAFCTFVLIVITRLAALCTQVFRLPSRATPITTTPLLNALRGFIQNVLVTFVDNQLNPL